MDTEEEEHLESLVQKGRSVNDEGPFYHHTFWESYKGAVKGKLGGLFIGGAIGCAVGVVAFGLLSVFVPELVIGAGVLIGGITAAGALYGMHEFGDVGRVTGAVAAGLKVEERRMHDFELGKFCEMKKDLNEIKTMVAQVAGNNITTDATTQLNTAPTNAAPAPVDMPTLAETQAKLADYRTSHFNDTPLKKDGGMVFWKVTLVGLLAGAAIGLLLATDGATAGVLAEMGLGALKNHYLASALTFGTIGASFGISRDLFRKVFDITDLLFKGFTGDVGKQKQLQPQQEICLNSNIERPQTIQKPQPVSTLVSYDSGLEYPTSDTFHRDQLAARAAQTLAALDHGVATRH
jgi:hypothetical protein